MKEWTASLSPELLTKISPALQYEYNGYLYKKSCNEVYS